MGQAVVGEAHAPLGLGLVDRELRFVLVNEELADINGLPAAEHPGRTIAEVLPELAPQLVPLFERVLATGEPIQGIEIDGTTRAQPGVTRSWVASYHPLPGSGAAADGVIAVVQEITAALRGERERQRLQRLVEESGDFVIYTMPMGALVYLNAAGRRYSGLGPEDDVSRHSMVDLVATTDRPRLETEVFPALEARGAWSGTFPVRNLATGEVVELDWASFFFEDAEHGILVGGIGRDQRARRAAEEDARQAAHAYEELLSASPVPIVTVGLDRRVLRINPAAERAFGWTADEVVGGLAPWVTPEERSTANVQAMWKTAAGGRVVEGAMTLRHRDGTRIRAAVSGFPRLSSSGEPIGSTVFLFDVEAREQARERAVRSSRQQQAVAELGLLALRRASIGAVFDHAVEALATGLGVEYAKILELEPGGETLVVRAGVGWREGIVGRARVPAALDSQAGYTLRTAATVVVEDLAGESRFSGPPLLREHGVVSGLSTLIEGEQAPWGVLGAHTAERRRFDEDDVSFVRSIANVLAAAIERERTTAAREAALRASSAKTDFLSRMSHELRTPLNAVVGFAQLLALDESDPGKRESVDQILAAGLHLVGLIDELLDVAQIESGVLELELERVDVAELAHEVVSLVSPLAGRRAIAVELRADGPRVDAHADLRRLRQVLLNVVSNAIKYNREGGSVEIAIGSADGVVSVAVHDTGPGIAPAEVARIFEPFQRAPGAARVEGTGLGLAVSRALLEAMGGRIRVDSSPGAGSVFVVEVPAAR